uniref:Uncharacterized protein n=1 Tax=Meleagris gallopavo TaxID=9103 RepID=A0A803XZ85_MELGA
MLTLKVMFLIDTDVSKGMMAPKLYEMHIGSGCDFSCTGSTMQTPARACSNKEDQLRKMPNQYG